MPVYRISNRTNGRLPLPAPVSRVLRPNETIAISVPVGLMERLDNHTRRNLFAEMVQKQLIAVTVANDPTVPDALESIPSGLVGPGGFVFEHVAFCSHQGSDDPALIRGSIEAPYATPMAAWSAMAPQNTAEFDHIRRIVLLDRIETSGTVVIPAGRWSIEGPWYHDGDLVFDISGTGVLAPSTNPTLLLVGKTPARLGSTDLFDPGIWITGTISCIDTPADYLGADLMFSDVVWTNLTTPNPAFSGDIRMLGSYSSGIAAPAMMVRARYSVFGNTTALSYLDLDTGTLEGTVTVSTQCSLLNSDWSPGTPEFHVGTLYVDAYTNKKIKDVSLSLLDGATKVIIGDLTP